MPPITLEQFENRALSSMLEFGTIASISPSYDAQWKEHGRVDAAAAMLADWARTRAIADLHVEVREIVGRTPLILITIGATADVAGTIVLYGHLDKQPPLGQWSEGLDPFVPQRRGDRIYARGLADDGYAIFASLLAIEDMEANGIGHARCVVLIEASEESGSPDLEAYLDEISVDLGELELLICLDSGALTYDRLWVTTSLRGNLIVHLTVEVLLQGQHSGSASGVVPSSFRIMRQLLDRIEDSSTGRILLGELHSTIPESHVHAAAMITEEFGDVAGDEQPIVEGLQLMGANPAERLLQRTWAPTLSITGVAGIPDTAIAGNVLRPSTQLVLSLRLPPNVDGAVAAAAVEKALLTNVPSGAKVSVDTDYANGWLAPELSPWLTEAIEGASQYAFGRPAGFAGEGGSIPFLSVLGERFPRVQFVATGVLGPGSNAHGIDEMLDLPTVVGVTNSIAHIISSHANATA